MKSVAVVGRGVWGSKIAKSLQGAFINTEVEVLSSRNFLHSQHNRDYDVIWIAGRPSEQVKNLEVAESISKLVILEKPLGNTLADFSKIEEIISRAETKIDLSRPWCFSNPWLNLKEKVVDLKLDQAWVTFKRSGPLSHSYTSPAEDWLPHDFYLASDLIPEYEIQSTKRLAKKTCREIRISLELKTGAILNFEFVESVTRESKVEIVNPKGEFFVDLIAKTLLINGKKMRLIAPDPFDELTRNLVAGRSCDNSNTMKNVQTQKWMKSLLDSL